MRNMYVSIYIAGKKLKSWLLKTKALLDIERKCLCVYDIESCLTEKRLK